MTQRRRKIDFSYLRRRLNSSTDSSASFGISPPVPVLESPMTFHALATPNISEVTFKQQEKLDRFPETPSIFFEDKEEEEDVPVAKLARHSPPDGRSARVKNRCAEQEPILQTKSQFFEDAFSTRGRCESPATRINQASPVLVELKVNIRIKDEDALISAVLSNMARIYQKSETYVMVTIQQDACLRFGSARLPAYLLKVFALPYLIAPITNLRNTALVQGSLQEHLNISPNRGVVLYIPISEENMGLNSTTMMGEIARLERESQDEAPGILRTLTRSMGRKVKSTSSHSGAPSEATTSSWMAGSDGSQATKPEIVREQNNADSSKNESGSRSSKSLRTLGRMVSRRSPERSDEVE